MRSYDGKVRLVKSQRRREPGRRRTASCAVACRQCYAFRDGQPIDGFVGAQPESAIKAFIDRLVADDAELRLGELLKAGEDLLEQGDLQGAAEVFATVLQEDRTNAEALAGLASCYMKSGDVERAKQTLALVPPDKREIAASSRVLKQRFCSRKKGADTSELAALSKRLTENPGDHQARFDLAVGLRRQGREARRS